MAETEEELLHGGKVMGLMDHLVDLRGALIRSFTAIMVLFFIALYFSAEIIGYLKQPLIAVLPQGSNNLHFTGPMDVFVASIKVSFLAAFVFGSPVWSYQFWRFLEPGLYPKERKLVLPFAVASILLFFAGVAFCYYLILPMALEFLIGLGVEVGTPIITVNDYISLMMIMIFGFGLVFETPVVLVLLATLDLVTAEGLASARSVVAVVVLTVSAILTPPDPISQIAMAIPVYLMYEGAILIIKIIKPKPKNAEEKSIANV